MERAAVSPSTPAAVVFRDGLGDRRHVIDPTGTDALELLCLRGELAAVPSFEFALRERVSHLGSFRHAYYGRVRGVERMTDRDATLAVVSDHTPGVRLSELLVNAEEHRLGLDINTALCLIRQLVPAVAMLHETTRDVAHGALGPERILVTPNARLVIVEYVLGAALEQLRYSPERYWADLRIALPRTAGLPRFDQRADVTQIGVVALSLILGRSLRDDEYPMRIADVVASTWAVSARGGFEPLPPGLRGWLGRALQLDSRSAFASAVEASVELDKVIGDGDYMASPASLEAFLAKYHAAESGSHNSMPSAGGPARLPTPPPRQGPTPVPLPKPQSIAPDAPPRDAPAAAAPQPPVFPAPSGSKAQPTEAGGSMGAHRAQGAQGGQGAQGAQGAQGNPDAFGIQGGQPVLAAPVAGPGVTTIENGRVVVSPRPTPHRDAVDHEMQAEPEGRTPPRSFKKLVAAVAVVTVLGGAALAGRKYFTASPGAAATGTLVISTNPAGAQVTVDGQARGATPLTLTLPPGAHNVDLRLGTAARSIPVTITVGQEVAQYIELPQAGATTGQLQIKTEPAGAKVTVDGVPVGTSPMMVVDLAPGEHSVALESDLGSVKQIVVIEAGVTASLLVPLRAAQGAPVSGWLSVTSPVEMQVFEDDQLLGTTRADRIMMSAGRHEVSLVNDTVGFRMSRVVQVLPGKVASVAVEVPKGTIALNALPWAEVWIDGEKVGETPIGNLPVAIGPRNVLFRHPQFGEQHHTVMVTLKGVARLSVDLRNSRP
jgi:hypothetical protein